MGNPKLIGEIVLFTLSAVGFCALMNYLDGKKYLLLNRIRTMFRDKPRWESEDEIVQAESIWDKKTVCPQCGSPNYEQRTISDTLAAYNCPDCGWSGIG